jgi:hypothetical protein
MLNHDFYEYETTERSDRIFQSGNESQPPLFPPNESTKRREIEKFATPEPVDPNPPAHYQACCSLQGSPARTNSVIDPVKKLRTVCVQMRSRSSSPGSSRPPRNSFQKQYSTSERIPSLSAYSSSIELDAWKLQSQRRRGRYKRKEEYCWVYHDSPPMSARHDPKPFTWNPQAPEFDFDSAYHHVKDRRNPVPEDEVDKLMRQWTTLDASEFVQHGI